MGYREISRVELQEVIRRWQAGESCRKMCVFANLVVVLTHFA
jgi:hypothetical protein